MLKQTLSGGENSPPKPRATVSWPSPCRTRADASWPRHGVGTRSSCRQIPVPFSLRRSPSDMNGSFEFEVLEVVELSTLMRTDPVFNHVRAVCRNLGMSPDELLLVQLIGSEESLTTGVLFDPRSHRTWHFCVGDYSLKVQVHQASRAADLDGQAIEEAVITAALSRLGLGE